MSDKLSWLSSTYSYISSIFLKKITQNISGPAVWVEKHTHRKQVGLQLF